MVDMSLWLFVSTNLFTFLYRKTQSYLHAKPIALASCGHRCSLFTSLFNAEYVTSLVHTELWWSWCPYGSFVSNLNIYYNYILCIFIIQYFTLDLLLLSSKLCLLIFCCNIWLLLHMIFVCLALQWDVWMLLQILPWWGAL